MVNEVSGRHPTSAGDEAAPLAQPWLPQGAVVSRGVARQGESNEWVQWIKNKVKNISLS